MSSSRLVDDIKAKLDRAEPHSTGDCCIYKVPSKIRKLNEDAYTPNVVSIGPFHHGHPQLQNMESQKLIHFKDFLHRTKACLNDLVGYIEPILPHFKRCYSETLPFSNDELVQLILIDSCFIIELFLRSCFKPWLDTAIRYNLLLLENQLPFFIIEKIYSLSLTNVPNTMIHSFLKLTICNFNYYNKSKLSFDNGDITSIRHFTDLIRIFHLQHPIESRPSRVGIREWMIHLPSATELLEAGVRFKVNTESKCLLDLRFSKSGGVLEIPQLKVQDSTETLFRNMVALEQCHYPYESYITDYRSVLDYLINTGKDVDILVQNKILENWLEDSDSVAILFNGLGKNIINSNISSHFSVLCKDINVYCRNPWHKLKATLRRDYCNTPWQTAASIAGIVLLVLTLLQSVCSVLQVVQKKILENWLGDSDSVANMFNGLGKNVIRSNISSHFSILCNDLNAFCSNPWNTWKAALRRDYCKTPWQAAASFAGIVLLVLTFIQSVCSVLQVVQASW